MPDLKGWEDEFTLPSDEHRLGHETDEVTPHSMAVGALVDLLSSSNDEIKYKAAMAILLGGYRA